MNKIKKFNLKKTLTLIATLTLALCLTLCVACGGDSGSSSSSSGTGDTDEPTVTATDYQSIKNGDFEFGTSKEDITYPVYTGINWTRYRDNSYPTSAVSSTKNSGIIDTDDEAYNKIAEANGFPKDGDNYWNPKTPQSYGLGGERYEYNEETFQDNPNEDKLCTKGSKILMIHNVTSVSGRGTAQKFVSSSSLSTTTGYGKISVWVMTKDLKSIQLDQEYGAYISVNNTLSSTRSPFLLKNIDTKGAWAEYVIYLKASDYAKSSFTVTVGLGFGSDTYKAEYVEGFAYFDDIHFEELDKEAFETETADVAAENQYNLFDGGEEAEAETLKISQFGKTYAQNAENTATSVKYVYSHLMDSKAFTSEFTGEYNKVYQHDPEAYATGATAGKKAFSEIGIDGVTNPYGETAETAFIKLDSHSSYTLTSGTFEIADGQYKQFNFLTNVNVEVAGQPGAKIEVEEVNNGASEVYGTVSVASDYNTYSADDNANVWKKVSIFVKNDLGTTRYIRFKFTLGTTDNVFDAAEYHLTKGYALFTGFTERELPEKEYNIVSSQADYKSTITLGYEYPNGPTDDEEEEENFAFTATGSTKYDLDQKPASGVSGYTGVVGNHTMVGGNKSEYAVEGVTAGIVSSKNVGNYQALTDAEKTAITDLANNTNIQPLIIKNAAMNSYGYLGSQLTLAANTTTLISVQVKVLDGATAYVYLANADPLSYFGTLKVADKPLEVAVTSTARPTASTEWVTVNFLVTTGDEEITYRVELWNGSRDGNVQSQGTVLFNNVLTSESANVTATKAKLDADFVTGEQDLEVQSYTRAPSKVTYTDADGNEVSYDRTYEPTVAYTKYLNGSSIIASYEAIHAPDTIDETTKEEEETNPEDSASTEEPANPESANWGLQVTSIVIAAVLVVVLAIVVIRLLVKKNKKVEVAPSNYYNRDSRAKTQAIINANKAKRAQKAQEAQETSNEEVNKAEETTEETTETTEEADNAETEETEEPTEEKPYDYDNPENNV